MTIAVLGIRGFPGVQGGVEVHSQHLYPLMTQCHFRIYRRKPYLTDQSMVAYDNIDFIDWRTSRVQGLEAVWHTLCAVMHCMLRRPDMVHVHNMGPALLALPLRWLGIPLVMTYHSVNYEHSKWGSMAKWFLRLSERLSLRYCDRIIFVNHMRMWQMPESVQHKCTYIPNGIDPVLPIDSIDFLARHGIAPGEYVLAVGRITPEKGFDYLVCAANRSDVIRQVVVAGGCDHNDDYMARLKSLDVNHKVKFLGFVDKANLNQLYSHARLFVLPSLSEGFPLVMLEAMAHGLPIVASDIDATRLVNLPDGNYCPPGDAEALRRAIVAVLSHQSGKLKYDLSAYAWPVIADRTQEVYAASLG